MQFGPKKARIHSDLPNRFCYWQGERGQSYLFSRVEYKDLSSFSDCVLLISIEAEEKAPELFWIGHVAELPSSLSHDIQSLDHPSIGLYVHLLAGSVAGQKEVIDDLSCEQKPVELDSVA
jgi:hypothetical protein